MDTDSIQMATQETEDSQAATAEASADGLVDSLVDPLTEGESADAVQMGRNYLH